MHNNLLLAQPSDEKLYVEDVFSTYLYTGNGGTQTITNGIDLAGKGGLVWIKGRTSYINNFHVLTDTARGAMYDLYTDYSGGTSGQYYNSTGLTSFGANGFSVGAYAGVNSSGASIASWTFRKAPKFFDVVTFSITGGAAWKTINHSLGVTPGMIIIKSTSYADEWYVYHRSTSSGYLRLNGTDALNTAFALCDTVTSTSFRFSPAFQSNSQSYVAYLFAHDTSADGIVQCGSFNNGTRVELGWEPQWVLIRTTSSGNWWIQDSMRDLSFTNTRTLQAESSAAESSWGFPLLTVDATGFTPTSYGQGNPLIYVAIRRGPMRTPTDATKVFAPYGGTATGSGDAGTQGTGTFRNTGWPVDLFIAKSRNGSSSGWWDRLRGGPYRLWSDATSAENTTTTPVDRVWFDYSNGAEDCFWGDVSSHPISDLLFRRAPGFFDVVCYTGTGGSNTINHNLGVVPEMIIVKRRNGAASWTIGTQSIGVNDYLTFSTSSFNPDGSASQYWGSSWPSKTSLNYTGGYGNINSTGATYVAYLFASCPGVSKVGSYTGNGSSLNIDCGFTNGARFVLIKRTDSTGDWYVWDTARGIVTANDPHLSLNTTAAEVTTNDTIDPLSTGFTVNQVAATNVNVNAATYIYLAIA